MTIEELATAALESWGDDAQKRQAAEECIELALALRHFERGKVGIEAVAEEIAGVEIMLEQLRRLVPSHVMASAREAQLAKLAGLLGHAQPEPADAAMGGKLT